MTLFVVISLGQPAAIEAAMGKSYPNDNLKVAENVWLVSAGGTSKTVSDELKISGGENGSGMVFSSAGYFGRSAPTNWEWITNKLRVTGG